MVRKLLINSAVFGLISAVACAPKHFNKDPEVDKCQNFSESCITKDDLDVFNYTVTAQGGKVDIIFVDDNSGSMSPEQDQIARRFENFLSVLDSRAVNYRIGAITTDVSSNSTLSTEDNSPNSSLHNPPRSINQNGQLQDGNLIKVAGSRSFISSTDSNKVTDFANLIQRPETRTCEEFLKTYPSSQPLSSGLMSHCPAGDERGIFAMNLFLDKSSSILRDGADLSFVVLADEDVRSGLYKTSSDFSLEEKDKAAVLVQKIKEIYPNKRFSIHSIIVKPNDTQCESAQNHQMGPAYLNPTYGITFNQLKGSQGLEYSQATQLTNGILGSVCDTDYTNILRDISTSIADQISAIKIACSTPGSFKVLIDNLLVTSWTLEADVLRLNSPLEVGQKLDLSYTCPKL